MRAIAVILCGAGTFATAEVFPTDIGPINVYFDHEYVFFDEIVTQTDGSKQRERDLGALRFAFPDGRPVPFSNDNEVAVRQAFRGYCMTTTGNPDFDEFVWIDPEMVGRCMVSPSGDQ